MKWTSIHKTRRVECQDITICVNHVFRIFHFYVYIIMYQNNTNLFHYEVL